MTLLKDLVAFKRSVQCNEAEADEEKQMQFSAHNVDSLIKELQQIKELHGNIGLAIQTPSRKWSTEGVSLELEQISAYGQNSMYVCFTY